MFVATLLEIFLALMAESDGVPQRIKVPGKSMPQMVIVPRRHRQPRPQQL
jgi:hypothetical protein